jgi:amidase
MSTGNWEEIARNKRQALLAKIPAEYRIPPELEPPETQLNVAVWPRESGWFTQKELEITESTATTILQKIAAQEWSSEEVTRAFCKRAAASHQLVSAPNWASIIGYEITC